MTEVNFNELLRESAQLSEIGRNIRRTAAEISHTAAVLTQASVFDEDLVFVLHATVCAVQEEAVAAAGLAGLLDNCCNQYSETEKRIISLLWD